MPDRLNIRGRGCLRIPKPYAIAAVIAVKILFCVCLAHARQQGLGTPVATGVAFQNSYAVTGKILSAASNEPLDGATISIQGKQTKVLTNADGAFRILASDSSGVLLISFVGYQSTEINFNRREAGPFTILLESNGTQLEEVEVSTGYQTLPKERATGSFVQVDNELLNRSVSPDILSRLNGVTNGLLFDKASATGNTLGINIRGRSTIFSDTKPLIVVDNFPFEGDINSINPNDIQSVSILKDAAAASIWGVRAGNGVIVITTKKGISKKPAVSLNANITLTEKPDLFYQPQLSSSEYIEVERFLYEKGYFNANLNNPFSLLSPVVVALDKAKRGLSSTRETEEYLQYLASIDNRDQIGRHFYRKGVQQQYHFNISGGGNNNTYFFSGGYDKSAPNERRFSNDRFTLRAQNTFKLLKDKLSLSSDIIFSSSKNRNDYVENYVPFRPYENIEVPNGERLAVLRSGGLREAYTDTAGNGLLLDWKNRPLQELNGKHAQSNGSLTDYRINLNATYKIIEPLAVSASYQFYKASGISTTHYDANSFYARNLVNTFSRIMPGANEVIRPVPLGGILNSSNNALGANYGRFQMNFNKSFNEEHSLVAIAGYEIREDTYSDGNYRLYGYDEQTATNIAVDLLNEYEYYWGVGSGRISNNAINNNTLDRYISYYANGSYTYRQKYIVSASFRKDESNLFGVKANQKGVPLWSAGLAYNLSEEDFLKAAWISNLKLRLTYGYNGNVNKSVSAYLTASPASYQNIWRTNFYQIVNPPNNALRWERVKNLNSGIDFSLFANRISGSIEYYFKDGIDLIGTSPIAPQTGISQFTGNTARTKTNGLDIQLNAAISQRQLKWNTTFILNYVKDKVIAYYGNVGSNVNVVNNNDITPIEGYPINAIVAFNWGGLNGDGNPLGYLNGQLSDDYTNILNATNRDELHLFGSAVPTLFGGFRNSFAYKNLDFSFNLVYKLGYYFRRQSINYFHLYGGNYRKADYAARWQTPGDESFTEVPAMVYPVNNNREDFYTGAAVLVEKGDHIRLRDIQLSYSFGNRLKQALTLQDFSVYLYASNLGVLWRANKHNLDPQVTTGFPDPKSVAIGFKANF